MDISMFNFDLPCEHIAQEPLKNRHACKMMVIDRESGEIYHRKFYDILDYINPGDVVVLNDTRVFSARVKGINIETGGKIEFLILKNIEKNLWEVMSKPGKRAVIGKVFLFGNGELLAKIVDIKHDGNRIVEFMYDGDLFDILERIGDIPIPPYVHKVLEDKEDYQTVYSSVVGSVAAPTAGLHFTRELLSRIKNKGAIVTYITLHVGLGTFMPVKVDNIQDHVMHSEYCEVSKYTSDVVNLAKSRGNKIIAVGTTTVRTLESSVCDDLDGNFLIRESSGYTNIFIKPGYEFKVVDSMVTNFHLPKSTLMVLVSAFYSRDGILDAYSEAILHNYKFFSFGDSMFLV